MQRKMTTAVLAGALLAWAPGLSYAEDADLAQMKAEMAQMRAEMAQLRAEQQGDWMDQARRAEVEGMIADAFADAQNRATLLQEGALAGINDKGGIFLQSSDGQFKANFYGEVETRYIWNTLDTDNTSGTRISESVSGFQVRRAKLGIKGSVADGWGYKIQIATNRATANAFLEDAYLTHDLGDGWTFTAGSAKLPFARQELISDTKQVALDRSLVTEFFTLNRSDLVMVDYENDDIKAAVAVSDGGNANFSEFNTDASNDFAVTGRVDWRVMGDWSASGTEFGEDAGEDALFVGGAVHYEAAEGGGAVTADSGLAWTADALWKTGNFGISAALFGNHTSNVGAADTDQYGLHAQVSYIIPDSKWDVFARWEYIDDDGVSAAATSELEAITFGANHHFTSKVKLTGDVVWIYSGDAPTADGNFLNGGALSSGLGLTSTAFTAADAHDDQIAVRLQLKVLF